MSKNFTINELREKRARKWEEAKNYLDTHRNSEGYLAPKDVTAYEAMEKQIISLGDEIKRMERGEEIEAELNRPTSSPLTNRPGAAGETKTGRASDAYKNAFLNGLRTRFRTVSDVLYRGSDAAGGYLVPESWDSNLVEKLEQENFMRKLSHVFQTSSDRRINITASLPNASWVEENAEISTSDPSWTQARLDSYKLVAATRISEELLEDNAYDLGNVLIDQLGRSLARGEESAFLVGDGNNKPTGIFNAAGGGQIGVTAASEDSITADEVLDLIYSLARPYRTNAVFLTNDSTLAMLRKLKDGNGQYIWQPSLTAGEPDRLLGYSIYTSPFIPSIGAGQPVAAIANLDYYYVADRGVRSFAVLNELYAMNGQVGYKATERVDGKLILPEAVKLLKMGGTAAQG